MAWEWHMIEEEKALRALRKVVDVTAKKLRENDLDEFEALRLMEMTRHWVSKVFPEKLQAYDAIYKPRLESIYYRQNKA
ncbi:MAG: hypothetical protein ABSG42_00145 [Nitrospirota bacterium]